MAERDQSNDKSSYREAECGHTTLLVGVIEGAGPKERALEITLPPAASVLQHTQNLAHMGTRHSGFWHLAAWDILQ